MSGDLMRAAAIALALFAVTVVACGTDGALDPPLGLPHAVATASCGPADGPAVAVLLSSSALASASPPPPYVQLSVWRPATEVVGTWSVSPASPEGAAARIGPVGTVADVATRGSITVLAVRADGTVVGNVDVVFTSGERVRGGFRARWISASLMCG